VKKSNLTLKRDAAKARRPLASYMDAHILPDISVDDFEKVKIAFIHPDFI
jgi:hypothetical protein